MKFKFFFISFSQDDLQLAPEFLVKSSIFIAVFDFCAHSLFSEKVIYGAYSAHHE